MAKPCGEIDQLDSDDFDSLVDAHMKLIWQYGECSRRHDAVVKAWKDLK